MSHDDQRLELTLASTHTNPPNSHKHTLRALLQHTESPMPIAQGMLDSLASSQPTVCGHYYWCSWRPVYGLGFRVMGLGFRVRL